MNLGGPGSAALHSWRRTFFLNAPNSLSRKAFHLTEGGLGSFLNDLSLNMVTILHLHVYTGVR
ncbi:hypothetical protein SAMN05216178_3591 [Pseudomonas saponiphila]|uniref:Uncharacterized protein n=1 Tax=Pseudomonas saponiphila TaxID=556534 RepID=A0A1H4Q2H8_9PSED|nr:hypothetical protein SAMN05216178_3591 [Pseudomonas saponiphila]